MDSLRRIYAMFLRYFYLHRRSLARTLEIFFWPVMELLVWGFLTRFLQQAAPSSFTRMIVFLIGAIIFWDILYRSQQGVSISVMEELWTRNFVNLLITPLRMWEWLVATFLYGLFKITIITIVLAILASLLYSFHLGIFGFYLIPFIANLLFFGWALGVFTSGILIRWGHAAEALIWGIPFFVQPISAVFYPVEVYPKWLQAVSMLIPSTHVFEGMRSVIQKGSFEATTLGGCLFLNVIYFALAGYFLARMIRQSRESGKLAKLGTE